MNVYLGALVTFIIGFVAIGFDITASEWLHSTFRPIDPALQTLTWIGDGRVLIPFCFAWATYLFARGRRNFRRDFRAPVTTLVAWMTSGAAVQILKIVFGRPRPYLAGDTRYPHIILSTLHWFTRDVDFASFPSGHSTAVFAVAWTAAYAAESRRAKTVIFALAFVVALTRVALAKHFFADTLAGAAVGVFFAKLSIQLLWIDANSLKRRR